MTAMYERSIAGAVTLKMPIIVWADPMPMQLRQTAKITTSQTAFTGVCVRRFTLLQNLCLMSAGNLSHPRVESPYPDKGKALSRAKAYAILVSANMAEQPVKN